MPRHFMTRTVHGSCYDARILHRLLQGSLGERVGGRGLFTIMGKRASGALLGLRVSLCSVVYVTVF